MYWEGIFCSYIPGGSDGKESACNAGGSLGQDDPLKKGITTHSMILGRRLPWTEESGKLQSMGSQRVRHNWATNTFIHFKNIHLFIWLLRVLVVARGSLLRFTVFSTWQCTGFSLGVVHRLSCLAVYGFLIPHPGIEPKYPALQNLSHWSTRKVPEVYKLKMMLNWCWIEDHWIPIIPLLACPPNQAKLLDIDLSPNLTPGAHHVSYSACTHCDNGHGMGAEVHVSDLLSVVHLTHKNGVRMGPLLKQTAHLSFIELETVCHSHFSLKPGEGAGWGLSSTESFEAQVLPVLWLCHCLEPENLPFHSMHPACWWAKAESPGNFVGDFRGQSWKWWLSTLPTPALARTWVPGLT